MHQKAFIKIWFGSFEGKGVSSLNNPTSFIFHEKKSTILIHIHNNFEAIIFQKLLKIVQNGSCDQKMFLFIFFRKLYYLISVLGKVAKGAHKKFGIGNSFPFILFSYQFFGKITKWWRIVVRLVPNTSFVYSISHSL